MHSCLIKRSCHVLLCAHVMSYYELMSCLIMRSCYVLLVRSFSTNEVKKGEIGKMFLRRRFDVCALSKTKLKGKGEVMLGDVVGRVSGVAEGRARKGVALLLSGWLRRCVVEWKEVSSRLMWVRDRKSTRLNSSHSAKSRMPSSA